MGSVQRSSCWLLETLPTPELFLTWRVGLCKLSGISQGLKKKKSGELDCGSCSIVEIKNDPGSGHDCTNRGQRHFI